MLKATRALNPADPGELIVKIAGVLDARFDFKAEFGEVPARVVVDCAKVTHANSSLVAPWMIYFHSLHEKGVQVRFRLVPTALVPYFNLVKGFAAGGVVESVLAPLYCKHCDRELTEAVPTPDRESAIASAKSTKCPKCGRIAAFDDKPKWYFSFLPEASPKSSPPRK